MPRKNSTQVSTTAAGAPEGKGPPSSHLEIRKSNETIGLRVIEGQLTLLNRKVFNVLMHHAQKLRVLGKNAPIASPQNEKYFWVPLSVLARDASYDSNDMKYLRDRMEEMQDIKLRLEDDTQQIGERLVSSFKFVNPAGLRSRSGMVWVGFAFPPEVYEHVMQPRIFTQLNIHYQGLLGSGASLALYEVCRRYATNPSKLTYAGSYSHWYGVLTGNPEPDDSSLLPEYKYFKRDVIKPAIAELKSRTDIEVTLIEIKLGRRVAQLQFKVELKPKLVADPGAAPLIDVTLLERMMKLGLNQNDASNILGEHEEERIRNALDVVEVRVQSKSAEPVASKPAYFRWALKEGVKLAEGKPIGKPAAGAKPAAPTTLERFNAERIKAVLEIFREMDEIQQTEVYDRFKAQSKLKVPALDKLLGNGVMRTALGEWYAHNLWGNPGVEEVARFADTNELDFGGEAD